MIPIYWCSNQTLQEEPTESGYTSGSADEAEADEEDKNLEESDSDTDSDSDEDDDDFRQRRKGGAKSGGGFEVVPQEQPVQRGKKRPALSAEELALGEKMIYSKKSKRDLMDAGWNR